MLWVRLETTTAQEICDGVVAMGETLFSCYLYGEIIARQHRPAFFVMSNTRCTQGYYMFLKISTSHRAIIEFPVKSLHRPGILSILSAVTRDSQ